MLERETTLNSDVEKKNGRLLLVKQWRSWKVKPLYIGVVATPGTSVAAAIITLAVLSHKNSRFATILPHDQTGGGSFLDTYIFDKGLL
jgi:hypothetical protein